MGRFNVSQWALRHRSLVTYFMVVVAIFGIYGYGQLSQSEDPPFTFKIMVVQTLWPGATATDVRQQVTARIARELQEVPNADFIRAYSRPGESMIFFVVKDSIPAENVPDVWYQVRKRVGDMAHTLPTGVIGPFFNDEFGDVYTNIYALEGDGYSFAELKNYADHLRSELLRVPDVAKVDYFGEQAQRVYIEISNAKLATLGISPQQIVSVLRTQNVVAPSGFVATRSDRIAVRASGAFDSVEDIRQISFRANGRLFQLGDIATVTAAYQDPPQQAMRFDGTQVLGIGVTMREGGDVIALGEHLSHKMQQLQQSLPVGLEIHTVTNMANTVDKSIDEFMQAVFEAVLIVLLVSLLSLGVRTGSVVVITIPLVLAATALFMWLFDIGLHKVSLGTLILALGLLVDDAIIAVEMMAVKLEQGYDRMTAAGFAYTSTAFPMLTGTLITVAGFIPIALAKSATGEYTRSIFQVSAIALLASWVAAVVVVPYLGYKLIPEAKDRKPNPILQKLRNVRMMQRFLPAPSTQSEKSQDTVYATPFYNRFRGWVAACVRYRKTVLASTAAIFLLSLFAFGFVPQQFFPASARPELLVDMQLPEGSSYAATLRQVKKMEAILAEQPEVKRYTAFVGTGAPRFFLPLDQKLPQRNFAQFLVLTADVEAREALRQKLLDVFDTPQFAMVRGRVTRLVSGPPVGYPVQFRVSGYDIATVRNIAEKVLTVVRQHPATVNGHFDWDEPSKVVKLDIDQEKARLLGLTSKDIAGFLHMSLAGYPITNLRVDDELIGVELRAPDDERASLATLESLAIPTPSGQSVPLSQIARFDYTLEPGIIWEHNRLPTITVVADLHNGAQGIDVTKAIDPTLNDLRAQLPMGYHIEVGGTVENSAKAQASINAGVPFMLFVIVTLLMLQLQSFRRTLMVLLTAPLGFIGVTAALLLFGKPFGFVAMLGTIAMLGIIMRNSVILVDQIEQDINAGLSVKDAIIEATVRRCRPIVLTAAAAVLALIPLVRSNFFGPMAVALMGGITVATILTLLFLPALYAAWMRVEKT
ncbi:MAG TPA: efflux RND transporter permease subunit [Gammaproteobacteria bacterium]|nr:efflux RND transporter permease subunit [Gammaproteobacteria bacterium]